MPTTNETIKPLSNQVINAKRRASSNHRTTSGTLSLYNQLEKIIKTNLENFDNQRKYCAYCGCKGDNELLGRCYGCQMVYYCSQEHQLNDWLVHMEKCSELEWVSLGELIQSLPAPPTLCDLGDFWTIDAHKVHSWTDWFNIRSNIVKVARDTLVLIKNLDVVKFRKKEMNHEDLMDGLLASITDLMTYALTIGSHIVKLKLDFKNDRHFEIVILKSLVSEFNLSNVDLIKKQFFELSNMLGSNLKLKIIFIDEIEDNLSVFNYFGCAKNVKSSVEFKFFNGTLKDFVDESKGFKPDMIVSFHPTFTKSASSLNKWSLDLDLILKMNIYCLFTFYDEAEYQKADNLMNIFQTNLMYKNANQFSSLLMKQLPNKPNNVYSSNAFLICIKGLQNELSDIDNERTCMKKIEISQKMGAFSMLDSFEYHSEFEPKQVARDFAIGSVKQHNNIGVQTIGLNEPQNNSLRYINGKLQILADVKTKNESLNFVNSEKDNELPVPKPKLKSIRIKCTDLQANALPYFEDEEIDSMRKSIKIRSVEESNNDSLSNSGYLTGSSDYSECKNYGTSKRKLKKERKNSLKYSYFNDNNSSIESLKVQCELRDELKSENKTLPCPKPRVNNNIQNDFQEGNVEFEYECDRTVPKLKPRKPKPKPRLNSNEIGTEHYSPSMTENNNINSDKLKNVTKTETMVDDLNDSPSLSIRVEKSYFNKSDVNTNLNECKKVKQNNLIDSILNENKLATVTKEKNFSSSSSKHSENEFKAKSYKAHKGKLTDEIALEHRDSVILNENAGFVSQMKYLFEKQMQQNSSNSSQNKREPHSNNQIKLLTAKLATTNNPLFNKCEELQQKHLSIDAQIQDKAKKELSGKQQEMNIINIINNDNAKNEDIYEEQSEEIYSKLSNSSSGIQMIDASKAVKQNVSNDFRFLSQTSCNSVSLRSKSCNSLSSISNSQTVLIKHIPDPIDEVKIAYDGERRIIVPGYMTSVDVLRNILLTNNCSNGTSPLNKHPCSLKEKLRMMNEQNDSISLNEHPTIENKPNQVKTQGIILTAINNGKNRKNQENSQNRPLANSDLSSSFNLNVTHVNSNYADENLSKNGPKRMTGVIKLEERKESQIDFDCIIDGSDNFDSEDEFPVVNNIKLSETSSAVIQINSIKTNNNKHEESVGYIDRTDPVKSSLCILNSSEKNLSLRNTGTNESLSHNNTNPKIVNSIEISENKNNFDQASLKTEIINNQSKICKRLEQTADFQKECVIGKFDANDFDSFDEGDSINVNSMRLDTTSSLSCEIKQRSKISENLNSEIETEYNDAVKTGAFDARDFDSFDEEGSNNNLSKVVKVAAGKNVIQREFTFNEYHKIDSKEKRQSNRGFFRNALTRLSSKSEKITNSRSSSVPPPKNSETKISENYYQDSNISADIKNSDIKVRNFKTLQLMSKMQNEYEEKQKRRKQRMQKNNESNEKKSQSKKEDSPKNEKNRLNELLNLLFSKNEEDNSANEAHLGKNETKRLSLRKIKAKDKAKKSTYGTNATNNSENCQSDSEVQISHQEIKNRLSLNLSTNENPECEDNNSLSYFYSSTSLDNANARYGVIKDEQKPYKSESRSKEDIMKQIRADLDEEIKTRRFKEASFNELDDNVILDSLNNNSRRKLRSKSVTFIDHISSEEEIDNYVSHQRSFKNLNNDGFINESKIDTIISNRKTLQNGDARLLCGALTGVGPIRGIIKKSSADLLSAKNTVNGEINKDFETCVNKASYDRNSQRTRPELIETKATNEKKLIQSDL